MGKSINDAMGANRFHMPSCSLCMHESGAETRDNYYVPSKLLGMVLYGLTSAGHDF